MITQKPRDFARLGRLLGWTNAADKPLASAAFYRRWTLAEALYKAGAAASLECFATSHQWLSRPAGAHLRGRIQHRRWQARWQTAGDNTLACVVWSTPT